MKHDWGNLVGLLRAAVELAREALRLLNSFLKVRRLRTEARDRATRQVILTLAGLLALVAMVGLSQRLPRSN